MAAKVYRFALGSPAKPLSLLWRLWTVDDEVHLAALRGADEISFTAYPTGRWRITIRGTVSRWHRPKEFRPGWTRGPDLVFGATGGVPHGSAKPARGDEPIAWLEPPGPGYVAQVRLLFASPRSEEHRWRPADAPEVQSMAMFPLRRAGALFLCRVDEADDASPDRLEEEPGAHGVVVSADQSGRPSLCETDRP